MTLGTQTINHVNFEDLDLPKIVYKYRECKNLIHKTILTERQVYFAPPSSFEDPIDCKNPIRYDLLKEKDIYNKYYLNSKQKNPNGSRLEHRNFAKDWTKKSPIKNKEMMKKIAKESFEDLDIRLGVLSLTSNPSNLLMWEKYSANHSGFCVGFDPYVAFRNFGGGKLVEYVDNLPIIMPEPIHSYEYQYVLQIFYKLKKWISEGEYRTHKFHINPYELKRIVTLPVDAYTEIIFGAKIDLEDKIELIEIVKNVMPNINIRQAQLTEENGIIIRDVQRPEIG